MEVHCCIVHVALATLHQGSGVDIRGGIGSWMLAVSSVIIA